MMMMSSTSPLLLLLWIAVAAIARASAFVGAPNARAPSTATRLSMSINTPTPQPTRPRPDYDNSAEGVAVVKRIEGTEGLTEALASHGEKLVVVKFLDGFCQACAAVQPQWRKLAGEYKDKVAFYEVDFSSSKKLCKELGITRLPTIQAFQGSKGKVLDTPAGPKRFPIAVNRILDLVEAQGEIESVAHISVPK